MLIPARDEERVIRATLTAVLGNRDVDLEVLVLDDQSQDATAAIVTEMSRDKRLRLVRGERLPAGWCGKQFACYQLSSACQTRRTAVSRRRCNVGSRCHSPVRGGTRERSADLISGFPRQIVGTLGEALLIPLIHIILLTYLPFRVMRQLEPPFGICGLRAVVPDESRSLSTERRTRGHPGFDARRGDTAASLSPGRPEDRHF